MEIEGWNDLNMARRRQCHEENRVIELRGFAAVKNEIEDQYSDVLEPVQMKQSSVLRPNGC